MNDSSKRIPIHQRIAYGFGDFGNGFMFDLGQSYLTKFWIDGVGLGAGVVGGIFAFTKIFDAFMDPIAGSVVDNRKKIGKRGKFRPIMMISAIVLGILTVITFMMPTGLSMTQKIIYAYAAYMIWGLVYSFTNDPYGSLASVMSRNVQDRALWQPHDRLDLLVLSYCWSGLYSVDRFDWWERSTTWLLLGICYFRRIWCFNVWHLLFGY